MDAFDNSDSESFSETSSEDVDDIFSIDSGQAKSILSNLEDSIAKVDDFLSFERSYTHGDIVRAVGDPSGQMGTIVNVSMFVDLENAFGKAVQGVDSRELVRIRSILAGDYVINGPWVGRVDKVVDCVGIIFDDGTKHEILATEAVKLIAVSANLLDESIYPYHPGQRVMVGLSSVSKSSGWLCGMLKRSDQEGIIYSVEAGSVYVDWLASALTCASTTIPPPPHIQDPKDLTILPCFPHTNWVLGEWCIFPVVEKNIQSDISFKGNLLKGHKKLLSGMNRRDFNSNLEEMYEIVKRKMKYDVMWQDGSQSTGLDSRALVPVTAVNSTDFFPENLVLGKTNCDDLNVSKGERWGVVKYVDANERIVKVEWKTMPENTNALDGKLNLIEDMVSAYELVEHPDFTFSFGDIVFMLEKNHFVGHTDVSTMREAAMWNGEVRSVENEIERCLSKVGSIIGFKDGDVLVQWANGITTQVAPYTIIRMDNDDGSLATFLLHETIAETNQEPTEQGKQSLQHKEKDSLDVNDAGEGTSTFLGFHRAAIGFFMSIATNFFGSHGSTSQGQLLADADMADGGEIRVVHELEVLKSSDICREVAPMVINNSHDHGDATVEEKFERTPENGDLLPLSCNQFKQFDIVGDCSDHHFVNGAGMGSSMSQVKRAWLKRVQQEWSILGRDLPETIYVRIYEESMDLIRAAIVGASGTPYHDGLFFFDIFLPSDYPSEPPLVHYYSGGLCLNPNLYESGRVCLSLLNTWRGTGTEVWNPGSSTVLQVLLSLQALVLNEKPYFNEAGYDKQIGCLEGEKNSLSYNENAFLVTCKSMLYLLRKPPKHFEGLIEEHFRRRSKHILAACKAYMKGTPVGSFGHHNTGAAHDKSNSTGFKIMLANKLFPRLVEAFSAIGADCIEFLEP